MKKKLLTISIAAYNVEKYLDKTLSSLIINDMDKLEVLIVNDGSKDKTKEIAQKYCKKYPNTFKLIDKENGGYGSTINEGIKHATGKYFKQLDGDDWYNKNALEELLNNLERIESDVLYTPYITHNEKDSSEIINKSPIEDFEYKSDNIDEIIINADTLYMHTLAYKTKLLKNNKITIEEHCFYTDTQYVMLPLLYSNTMHILNNPVYVYRLGREEQSVGIIGRKKHWLDHKKISYKLMESYKENYKNISENKRAFIDRYLATVFSSGIANYLMTQKPTYNQFKLIKKYDDDIKKISKNIYNIMGEKSKSVRIFRINIYIIYVALYIYKNLKWKIKK